MPTFFLGILFLLGALNATEYEPWLGNIYEFEQRTSFIYQRYSFLSEGSHHRRHSSNDFFLNLSLSNSLPDFGLEGELLGARTHHQKGDIDQIKLTGRLIWKDDVAGDPYSLATGLSLIQAFRPSLHDVSSFHHGLSEGELFLSVGKETSQETYWRSRWWSVFGLGASVNRGSAWIRFNLAYEKQLFAQQQLGLFMESLWGLGHKNLSLADFHGYGSIQHQSIDLGLRYTYLWEYFGNINVEYSFRVHARNFPLYSHHILLQLLYTFGL